MMLPQIAASAFPAPDDADDSLDDLGFPVVWFFTGVFPYILHYNKDDNHSHFLFVVSSSA